MKVKINDFHGKQINKRSDILFFAPLEIQTLSQYSAVWQRAFAVSTVTGGHFHLPWSFGASSVHSCCFPQ